jgi:large subunit ribosomal protein L18
MKILPKKRRIENKTNYTKRKRLLEGRKPRVVIRKTNKYIIAQYIESFQAQDKIIKSAFSKELLEFGWPKEKEGSLKSLPAAYLTGLLLGKRIIKNKEAILDTGLIRSTKGSKIYAALNGLVDSGFKIPFNKEVFPEKDRLESENVKDFFDKVKKKIMEVKE